MFDLLQRWHRAVGESIGGGGSRKMAVALMSVHAPSKNPHPVSRMQAYIAYSRLGECSETRFALAQIKGLRNVCRNAWETVVL
jgi:hypothetical protein